MIRKLSKIKYLRKTTKSKYAKVKNKNSVLLNGIVSTKNNQLNESIASIIVNREEKRGYFRRKRRSYLNSTEFSAYTNSRLRLNFSRYFGTINLNNRNRIQYYSYIQNTLLHKYILLGIKSQFLSAMNNKIIQYNKELSLFILLYRFYGFNIQKGSMKKQKDLLLEDIIPVLHSTIPILCKTYTILSKRIFSLIPPIVSDGHKTSFRALNTLGGNGTILKKINIVPEEIVDLNIMQKNVESNQLVPLWYGNILGPKKKNNRIYCKYDFVKNLKKINSNKYSVVLSREISCRIVLAKVKKLFVSGKRKVRKKLLLSNLSILLEKIMKLRKLQGIYLEISGRPFRERKKAKYSVNVGKVQKHSFLSRTYFDSTEIMTRNGVSNIKLWISTEKEQEKVFEDINNSIYLPIKGSLSVFQRKKRRYYRGKKRNHQKNYLRKRFLFLRRKINRLKYVQQKKKVSVKIN